MYPWTDFEKSSIRIRCTNDPRKTMTGNKSQPPHVNMYNRDVGKLLHLLSRPHHTKPGLGWEDVSLFFFLVFVAFSSYARKIAVKFPFDSERLEGHRLYLARAGLFSAISDDGPKKHRVIRTINSEIRSRKRAKIPLKRRLHC
jgi:hypothetical protein